MDEAAPSDNVFWARPVDKLITLGSIVFVGHATVKALFVTALRCVGFSSTGPVSGSWAAGHGHRLADATFSWLQSEAMTLPVITPSAAILGIISGAYFASRYYGAIAFNDIWMSDLWHRMHRPASSTAMLEENVNILSAEDIEESREEDFGPRYADLIDLEAE